MSRNINPEWYYGWDQEPEDACPCGGNHSAADHVVEAALDDDADAYRSRRSS